MDHRGGITMVFDGNIGVSRSSTKENLGSRCPRRLKRQIRLLRMVVERTMLTDLQEMPPESPSVTGDEVGVLAC